MNIIKLIGRNLLAIAVGVLIIRTAFFLILSEIFWVSLGYLFVTAIAWTMGALVINAINVCRSKK